MTAATLSTRAAELLALFKSPPCDMSSDEGRARERMRRVYLSALASMLAKGVSVLGLLISVPLTLSYLGTERYGMWVTIGSVVAMISFADLGIGNGLLNAVAEAHGRGDREAMRRHISSAYWVLAAAASVLFIAFLVVSEFVSWHRLFNVQSVLAQSEAAPALTVFVACFALNIPTVLIQRIQMGLQRGFVSSLWQCGASVLSLIGIYGVIRMEGGLPWLVAAAMGLPIVALCMNSAFFFRTEGLDLIPHWKMVCRKSTRRIVVTGGYFFAAQIAIAAAFMSDNLIIAQVLGADAVAEYAVPEKMFSLVASLIAMALSPLWPAYGEAIARGDHVWVRKILVRSVLLGGGTALLCSALLVAIGPALLSLWVGHVIAPATVLLVVLAVWKVLEAVGNSLAMYLNGTGMLRLQAVLAIGMAISAVVLKLLLVPRMGVAGSVAGTAIAYFLLILVPLAVIIPRRLREIDAGGHG